MRLEFQKAHCISLPHVGPHIYYKNTKVGGILLESEKIDNTIFLISGFGLNVNFSTDATFPDKIKAASLKSIVGKDLDREILLCNILEEFEKSYMVYTTEKNFGNIFKKIEKYMTY